MVISTLVPYVKLVHYFQSGFIYGYFSHGFPDDIVLSTLVLDGGAMHHFYFYIMHMGGQSVLE